MEFNDAQAEILSQAVQNGKLQYPLTDFLHEDVASLVKGGMLAWGSDEWVLYPTPYGTMVVKIYEREQAAYQRGYEEGFRDGLQEFEGDELEIDGYTTYES